MDAPLPDGGLGRVSRRRMLWLAGNAGLAAAVAACTSRTAGDAVPETAGPESTVAGPTASAVPSPAPLTSKPPAPRPVVSADMLCREAWGARPPRPGGRPHTISRMTLHHTAAVLGDNANAPARLRQHQRFHQDERGWIDIAYHVGVDRNGNIFELRTPDLAGDTATDYDPAGHFLVLCEGDFDQESVTEAQLNGAAHAFAWAAQTFHVTSQTLGGHRDFAATSCPGEHLYAELASGGLKRRIDDLLASGTVDLTRMCGPDAAARVAAIEAGR